MGKQINRDVRRRRKTSAWITVDGSFANKECELVDVSESGAKLLLDPTTAVPLSFWLIRVPKSPAKLLCDVIWQRGRTLGVKFIR